MSLIAIDGLDPLAGQDDERLIEEANKRIINNILKSYTGHFDLFSELIQNALDATEQKARYTQSGYEPKIWIEIDLEGGRVRVVDNGIGISAMQFRYFLKPNISFKKPKDYRGQKGVGATFLAYGFSLLRVHTRNDGVEIAANLRQGRQWALDQKDSVPRPKFAQEAFNVAELSGAESGTAVEIVLGGAPGERPRRLDWLGARTSDQWLDVLRIKTPLGGVYLNTSKFAPTVSIRVRDTNGSETTTTCKQPEYYYPHEMPGQKVATVKDIEKALSAIQGGSEEKFTKLESGLKRLDILWELYSKDEIADPSSWFGSALSDEERALVERHQVVVYASFMRSAKMWGDLNDNILKLKKDERIIHGGLQMASDFMPQGDLSIIP